MAISLLPASTALDPFGGWQRISQQASANEIASGGQLMFGNVRPRQLDGVLRGSVVIAALALSLLGIPIAHAQDATATVDILQFGFQPETLQVPVGTTVTWTNHDAIVHSVTNGTPDAPAGAFDSGLFDVNQTFSFTFSDPGDYTYFCSRHNFMHGTISVTPG